MTSVKGTVAPRAGVITAHSAMIRRREAEARSVDAEDSQGEPCPTGLHVMVK